eukprot:1662127-Lingulodinium_polyedra.AAC.1
MELRRRVLGLRAVSFAGRAAAPGGPGAGSGLGSLWCVARCASALLARLAGYGLLATRPRQDRSESLSKLWGEGAAGRCSFLLFCRASVPNGVGRAPAVPRAGLRR